MNRRVRALLVAQFLTAVGDNAILFALAAMVLQGENYANWYVPALQSSFLLAYILLAPWVGPFADSRPKPQVLIIGNLLKALGVGLILGGTEPLLAYALVGLGAAVYSPAKYGILPEMVPKKYLVKANSWIEASTITAIILGMLVGGYLADHTISGTLWLIAGLYLLSMLFSFLITGIEARGASLRSALPGFKHMIAGFLRTPRARFAMLGGSLFWGVGAVLRVLLVAWVPLVLATRSTADIAELTLFLGIGVIAGAALVPRLIPLEQLARARMPAYVMGILILLFSLVESIWPARFVLLFIGIAGGMFIVPINAALQEIGYTSIGSGHAVAIQNFFQNLAMLVTVGLYTLVTAREVQPATALLALGVTVLVATFFIARRLANTAR